MTHNHLLLGICLSALLAAAGCAPSTCPKTASSAAVSPDVGAPRRSPPASDATFGNDQPATKPHAPVPAPEQDPLVTDGDKYHVVLENAQVRVLRYQDQPGQRTHPHHHPEFVLYALSSFKRRLEFPDGTTKERAFEPGDVIWMPEQTHTGVNTGSTDTDVVLVEIK